MDKLRRMEEVEAKAKGIGLPESHARVLARISVRRRLDRRVKDLMEFYDGYSESMKNHKRMWDDPVGFADRAKAFRSGSGRRFPRYGSLSHAYTDASPYQVVNRLIKDAAVARSVYSMLREMDGSCSEGREYDHDLYGMQREKELEAAFRQDLRGNGIDEGMVDAIFAKLGWKGLELRDDPYGSYATKRMVMDSLYVFFSSDSGSDFIERWKREEDRPQLVKEFTRGFWNDPNVNPYLIAARPEDVGTEKFERRRQEFFDSLRYFPDGTSVRQGDVEMDGWADFLHYQGKK